MISQARKQKHYLRLMVQVLLVLFLFITLLPEAGDHTRLRAPNLVKQSQQDLFVPLQNQVQNLKLQAKQAFLFLKRLDLKSSHLPKFLFKSLDVNLFKRNSFYTCISINAP